MQRILLITGALCLACAVQAQSLDLPQRAGERPQTTDTVPHLQLGLEINRDLADALLQRVASLPGVSLGNTAISLPGAVGFHLDPALQLAQPGAIVGGLEFAHMHPDGSLHASLEPGLARTAIAAGWAVAHPWADQREGWAGFVMIYTPRTEVELEVVATLVEASYAYITGATLQN
ncbi:MAG: luciferase family protein [Pseudomonadota bacterium]